MDISQGDEGGCARRAPYALQVLGDSMEPLFPDGAVIIVDPDFPYTHGAYVVIDYANETHFRQFVVRGDQAYMVALNDNYPEVPLTGEYQIRGVITQLARNRRLGINKAKHFI